MSNKEIFLNEKMGDAWYFNNKADLGKDDIVGDFVERIKCSPKYILEIGCANGWRLERMRAKYGAEVFGIDPSLQAITDGSTQYTGIKLSVGTADDLPFGNNQFDLVIFGFCLSLCDSEDWFKVVSESNRVLMNGGYIAIHDYISARPLVGTWPYPYQPGKNIPWFFYDWTKLWLSHPRFKMIGEMVKEANFTEVVSVLQKDFPVR